MTTPYTYSLLFDVDENRYIQFDGIHQNTEFLKELLQILGMYNFIICTNQNIWLHGEIHATLTAPNGEVIIHIDSRKRIFLKADNNQKDLIKIDAILERFYAFRKINAVPIEMTIQTPKLSRDLVTF